MSSPTIETPTRRRPQFHALTVVDVEQLTEEAVAITFAVPADMREEFAFVPGQHLTLRRLVDGKDVRRSYSICLPRSRAVETGTLRVACARVPNGAMSTWLHSEVKAGDQIDVMTPMGTFTCPAEPDAARHHVAIAAGSGITPVMSILASALEEEPHSRATLIFGNRRTSSIMFLEELEDLKNKYGERFHLINVLSREQQDVELFSGRIDRERLERFFASLVPVESVDEWYLCGPFGMVENVRDMLAEKGVDEHHVHHEIFHVDEAGAPQQTVSEPIDESAPAEATVTINLDGRTTEVPMPSKDGESILAATLRLRPDAPYSCTGGVCGTCRARVVEGEVRMDRNYALEPDEVEKGIVLACQAHPVSEAVRLDYDA